MTTSPSNIPEAAVEAAGQALRDAFDWGVTDFDKQARAALEAAAPYMLDDAWEAGWKASSDWSIYIDMGGDEPECDNPYRSQG